MAEKAKTFAMLLIAAFLGAVLSHLTVSIAVREPAPIIDVQPVTPKPVEPVDPGFNPSEFTPTMK